MENIWLWIPLQLLIGIGFFYFLYQEDHQVRPLQFLKTIGTTFLRILATIFFGMFGFSFDQFDERNRKKAPVLKS